MLKQFIFISFMMIASAQDTLQIALRNTWNGIKQRNIDPYDIKCVHRPYSETPNDCVSEGIGYGMLLALYANDQQYFDLIFDSAERFMWNGKFYDWRINEYGVKTAFGAATDAEQDIALALIFAKQKLDNKEWTLSDQAYKYKLRAQMICNNMWNERMISYGKHVAPGAGWGGDDFVNPGYFAPYAYRIFEQFDSFHHDWNTVIDNCYKIILNNVGFKHGFIPDWTDVNGQFYNGNLGYNAYGQGRYLYKDAIRIFWRIGIDYLWNNEPRAKDFLEQSYEFISEKGGAVACNFYTMDGELLPDNDVWIFDGGQKTRHRREHSPLTIGMWSIVPAVLNKPDVQNFTQELLRYYETNATYWGLTQSLDDEDIQHNEMYFEQFLASFGALILNGDFIPITPIQSV